MVSESSSSPEIISTTFKGLSCIKTDITKGHIKVCLFKSLQNEVHLEPFPIGLENDHLQTTMDFGNERAPVKLLENHCICSKLNISMSEGQSQLVWENTFFPVKQGTVYLENLNLRFDLGFFT